MKQTEKVTGQQAKRGVQVQDYTMSAKKFKMQVEEHLVDKNTDLESVCSSLSATM